MGRKPFANVPLSVMRRLLCSLLVSLALTGGAVAYPSCTCQHYSQPLENRLLYHQLEQCIDNQSYRLITYCLHDHEMHIQGPGCQICFLVMPPTAPTFPPPEDPKPGWYPDTMALPSCPCTSVYMPCRCYNPEQVSVCQVNGETYWKGTIMQTKLWTNFALKNQTLPVGSMTQVIELTPSWTLICIRFSTQLITFLMTPTSSWPGIAGFAYP